MSATSNESSSPGFVKGLGLMDAILMVAGVMIGCGIFLAPPETARFVGSSGWMMVVWLLAGFMTLCGTLSYGELGGMMPTAGGQYEYLKKAYGKPTGFLYGWTLFLVIQTGTIAAVAIGFAKYLGALFPWINDTLYLLPPVALGGGYALSISSEQAVGVMLLLGLAWMNTKGLRTGKVVQNFVTFAKLGAIGLLILFGLTLGINWAAVSSNWQHLWDVGGTIAPAGQGLSALGGPTGMIAAVAVALPGALFASDGWYTLGFLAGELRNPGKNLPKALGLGTLMVIGVYFLTNMTYLTVLPFSSIQNVVGDRVGAATAEAFLPGLGAPLVTIAILVSSFGCVNGLTMAGARAFYSMAQDGLFFRRARELNTHHVPANALWIQAAWACCLVLPRLSSGVVNGVVQYSPMYGTLLTYVVASALLFYALTISAVFVFRITQPNAERPYRAIGYPVVPALFVVMAVCLLGALLYLKPDVTLPGLLLTLSGVPVYLFWRRRALASTLQPALDPAAPAID